MPGSGTPTSPSAAGTWHTGRRAASDVLRGLLAACVLLSAVVHLELWFSGFSAFRVVGPAFLLNAVGGLVLGVLLLVWRHWLPLLGALGFGIATFGAFLVSTTSRGLFGVHERWTGVPIWTSAITETAAIVLALVALVVERPMRRPQA